MLDYQFNSFKVKYIYLNKLFNHETFKNIQSVNLYINLECLINGFHQPKFEEVLTTCTKVEINNYYKSFISNIINLAAHYRFYFTKSKIESAIIFYYNKFDSYKMLNNTIYNDDYRKYYYNSYNNDKYTLMNSIITDGIPYAKTIADYIDRVYILSSDKVDSSLIPYIIKDDRKVKANLNMILTKDLYDFQYANHNFFLLYPDKEESCIIYKNNLMKFMRYHFNMDEEKIKIDISPKLITFILSVLGDKKRNMKKVTGVGFKKIYKGLEKLYIKDYIDDSDPNSLSIEHLGELIKTNNGFFDIGIKRTIGNNYFSIDLDKQYNILKPYMIDEILADVINKADGNGLKKLNDKVFSDYPIQLVELNNYYKNFFVDDGKRSNWS